MARCVLRCGASPVDVFLGLCFFHLSISIGSKIRLVVTMLLTGFIFIFLKLLLWNYESCVGLLVSIKNRCGWSLRAGFFR